MSNVLTSLGVKFYIGARETGSTNEPKNLIPQVIESSEIDLDPDTIETTSFDNMRYKSSVAGLIDTSGIQALTVNATVDEEAEAVWDAYAGKPAWLKIVIPNKADNTYIPIIPIKTGAYNVVINDRITIRLKYTVAGDMLFGETLKSALENSDDGGISGVWQLKLTQTIPAPLTRNVEQSVSASFSEMGDKGTLAGISYIYVPEMSEYSLGIVQGSSTRDLNINGSWESLATSDIANSYDFGDTPQPVSEDFMTVWKAFAAKVS
jgi:hypothetical protein